MVIFSVTKLSKAEIVLWIHFIFLVLSILTNSKLISLERKEIFISQVAYPSGAPRKYFHRQKRLQDRQPLSAHMQKKRNNVKM
jgi:hypothetical protein